jgi:hypothetical protein
LNNNGIKNFAPSWISIDKSDAYNGAIKKIFPDCQIVLCDWHEANALKDWLHKNITKPFLRDQVFYWFKYVKRSRTIEELEERAQTILLSSKLMGAISGLTSQQADIISKYFEQQWFCTMWKGKFQIGLL